MEHKKIAEWCRAAVVLLKAAGLSSSASEGILEAIERHANARAIYEIAEDLAEGVSHLQPNVRAIAQDVLVKDHGFGYDFFIGAKMKRVRDVLARGRICNEDEYRVLLDMVSDTTVSASLREDLGCLIAGYETSLAASKKSPPQAKRSPKPKPKPKPKTP